MYQDYGNTKVEKLFAEDLPDGGRVHVMGNATRKKLMVTFKYIYPLMRDPKITFYKPFRQLRLLAR